MMKMTRILAAILCLVIGMSVFAGAMATDSNDGYVSVDLSPMGSGLNSVTFSMPDPNQNNKLVEFTLQTNNILFNEDNFASIQGRILEKGTADWNRFYNQLDESQRSAVDENTAMIFEINVVCKASTSMLTFTIKVECQTFYGWNSGDLNFFYISEGEDENILHTIPVANNMVTGVVNHFSPYIIYKEKADAPVPAPVAPPASTPKTGDDSQLALWAALLVVSAGALVMVARKRRHA